MSSNFCFSILFDQNYIEPALLTAIEILDAKHENVDLYLVYLYRENDALDVEDLLTQFAGIATSIKVIKVFDTTLPAFGVSHFNNSIIYKLLIPSIINVDYILNIDAGTLLGAKFPEFIRKIQVLCPEDCSSDFVVVAYCNNSNNRLPPGLALAAHVYYEQKGFAQMHFVGRYHCCLLRGHMNIQNLN